MNHCFSDGTNPIVPKIHNRDYNIAIVQVACCTWIVCICIVRLP